MPELGTDLTSIDHYQEVTGSTASDDRIHFLISAASDMIVKYCGRDFIQAEITEEKHKGFGRLYLYVDRPPIVEVSEIRISGTAVDEDDYEVFLEKGMIFKKTAWPWSSGYYQDLTKDPDPESTDYNIEIDYTGGYILTLSDDDERPRTEPYDLELACVLLVQFLESCAPGLKSESIGNYKYENDPAVTKHGMPSQVIQILSKYQKAAIV